MTTATANNTCHDGGTCGETGYCPKCPHITPPPCENCGQPAVMSGVHPEAGRCYVCDDCWRGQGFEELKAWDYWRKKTP